MNFKCDITLKAPDLFWFNGAQGWLELGNPEEALTELNQVKPELNKHHQVLELRWQILAKLGQWEEAVVVAECLVSVLPGNPSGWIHGSYALHELGRTQEALTGLLRAHAMFPKDPLICYNLACYECRLGNLTGCKNWLLKAYEQGGEKHFRELALKDPDLEAIRGDLP